MMWNKACEAPPGHTRFLDNRRIFPVVVSAPRFEAIMARSRMDKKHADLAAAEEDRRYMQYLKDGSDWLCSQFTSTGAQSLDEEKQAKLDQELKEAAIREKQVKLEDDRTRKERVIRANRILEDLKAGQRALHHAAVECEVARQRKFNEALNLEILEDARRQQRLDEELCPEVLIPFQNTTEEQEKAIEQQKALAYRTYLMQDLEDRRQRRLAEKEQEEYDVIIERAQYKCLEEKEKKAAKERAEKNREFCLRAHRNAIKEKAEIKKYERMCDQIDDRVICVDVTSRRNLDKRYNKTYKAMIAEKIRRREDQAIQLCRQQQAIERKDQELRGDVEERYAAEVQMDEARRQCELQELSKQRRAYELEEREETKRRQQRAAEIRRFETAERFKNQETNKRFYASQKRKRDKATADLRHILHGQRDEFLKARQDEQMRMNACQEDPYLEEDVNFFNNAVKMMSDSRKVGRPIFPLVTAVEMYKRKNQLDMVPEGRSVGRSRIRDYCWPGYYSKADLAYRQYEHREKCRQELEKDRHGIFNNCIKITKMAAEEQPYKKCIMECPIKCFQHRGMPAIESVDSFDCGSNVCYEDDPLPGGCHSAIEVMQTCDQNLQATKIHTDSVKSSTNAKTSKDLGTRLQTNISKPISVAAELSKAITTSTILKPNSGPCETTASLKSAPGSSRYQGGFNLPKQSNQRPIWH